MSDNIAYQFGVETEIGISFKKVNLVSPQGLATAEYLKSLRWLMPIIPSRLEKDKLNFTIGWDSQINKTRCDRGFVIPLYCFRLTFDARSNTVILVWRQGLSWDCYSVIIEPHSLPSICRQLKKQEAGLSHRAIVRVIRKTNPFAPITKASW